MLPFAHIDHPRSDRGHSRAQSIRASHEDQGEITMYMLIAAFTATALAAPLTVDNTPVLLVFSHVCPQSCRVSLCQLSVGLFPMHTACTQSLSLIFKYCERYCASSVSWWELLCLCRVSSLGGVLLALV